MKAEALYCITYRTGGTENYQWHRSLAMTRELAERARANNERMGYPSYLVDWKLSLAVGLPDTYEVA